MRLHRFPPLEHLTSILDPVPSHVDLDIRILEFQGLSLDTWNMAPVAHQQSHYHLRFCAYSCPFVK